MRAYWGASLVAQPFYNATYATWGLRFFDQTCFANVLMPFNMHTTSPAASSCAFYAGHYLGVENILRWGLGRVRSLEKGCHKKSIRISYEEIFITEYVVG